MLWALVIATAVFLLASAWVKDRMANDLRDTGKPEYTDPYQLEWADGRLRDDIDRKHRTEFPESKLRYAAAAAGIGSAILYVVFRLALANSPFEQQLRIENQNQQTMQEWSK